MSKHSITEKSTPKQRLDVYRRAWRTGEMPCPSCEKPIGLNDLPQMQLGECPHCHQTLFMPRRLGCYYLYEPCGGGGMGSVYKAVSVKYPGYTLAVKVLARKELSNPGNIRALINEAVASENFGGNEFVAACLDHGHSEGEYYTVMPFISGERLDKRIERLTRLPVDQVLRMTLHILAAEQHIYSCGYLFRDMKPENIVINQAEYAVLLDFGLCLPLEQARNPNSEFISGSPYYMPPERLLGQPEDANSEIYSIGMVMYHAMTGQTYYDADGLNELAKRHVSKMQISSAAKMEELPAPVGELMARMIRQEPAERPQTFSEVFQSIQDILPTLG